MLQRQFLLGSVLAGLCVLDIASSQSVFASQEETTPADYTVSISPDDPRRAHVSATLMPKEGKMCFDRAADDTGLTHGWATFVHKLKIEDPNGQAVGAQYDGNHCWALDSSGPVSVSYTVLLQHDRFPNMPGDDELAYAGDWGQFWTGRALFAEGAPTNNVTVTFSLPKNWAVTAPWGSNKKSTMVFSPSGFDALFDSGFMVGTHSSRTFQHGNAIVRIGLAGEGPEARSDELVTIASDALSAFSTLHESGPEGYLAIFLGRGRTLGGGVMGQTISMVVVDDVPDQLMPTLSYIVIHEAFHLWNANFNYADVPQMYWFSEGFAEYFTHLQLRENSMIDASTLRERFEQRAERYEAVAGVQSMASAGTDKLNNYDLIYSGGMMAALALDMQIRKTSNGDYRLGDVLPVLAADFGPGSDEGLSNAKLAEVIERRTGVEVGSIVDRYVNGLGRLPTSELIDDFLETYE